MLPMPKGAKMISPGAGLTRCWGPLLADPARKPVDMENLLLFTGFCTCQVVQDFFHQQYLCKKMIDKNLRRVFKVVASNMFDCFFSPLPGEKSRK